MNGLNVSFVCNRKKPKIKNDTLTGSKDQCGLVCAWVLRMQQGAGKQCMTIPAFYLGNVGGPFIFDCDYDINLLNLNIAPAFYIDVLKSWADAQDAREQDDDRVNPVSIILVMWSSKNITIAGKLIY